MFPRTVSNWAASLSFSAMGAASCLFMKGAIQSLEACTTKKVSAVAEEFFSKGCAFEIAQALLMIGMTAGCGLAAAHFAIRFTALIERREV